MQKSYKKLNIVAAIFGFAIIAAFIIVGSFLDYDISSSLYNAENPGFFAIFGSIAAQAPTFLGVTFAGALLLIVREVDTLKEKKKYRILLLLAGIGFIALGTFFSFYYALKLKDFANIGKGTKYFIYLALAVVICLGLNFLIVFATLKSKNRFNLRKAAVVALFILLVVGIEVLIYQALKVIISRPRPRYIFSLEEPLRIYQNWWDLSHPFKAFVDENCKSCPSGHASNAMALPFILVAVSYLFKDMKFSVKLTVFIIGYLWAVIWAFSRVCAGAHFFSDIGLGMLISFITGVVLWNFFVRKYKIDKFDEAIIENK